MSSEHLVEGGTPITERDWLACTNPYGLLGEGGPRLSARKLHLLGCALARQWWEHLRTPFRQLIEVLEAFADGRASDADRRAAQRLARWDVGDRFSETEQTAGWLAASVADLYPRPLCTREVPEDDQPAGRFAEHFAGQADLVRNLLGNPFVPEPVVDPAWLAWRDCKLWAMAEEIYDGRAFADLPILADALEDAGCSEQSLLDHLRGPGPHARGCWALDLLLGREQRPAGGGLVLRGPTRPPYLTVVRPVEVARRLARVVGPRGLFARVWLRIEPWPGPEGVVFRVADAVERDSLAVTEYLPGIVAGLREALCHAETGEPGDLGRVLITLQRIQAHPVDSSPAAFRTAAAMALDAVLSGGDTVLVR